MNVTKINLRHFVTVHVTRILESEAQLHRGFGREFGSIQRSALIIKPSVTQPITKREQRFATEITIGPIAHGIVVKSREIRGPVINAIGKRPEGFESPKSTSPTARPPSSPGYQACKIAGRCVASHGMATALPLQLINTTGLPVASNAWSKSLLHFWQFNTRAITTVETVVAVGTGHLFTLEIRTDATDVNNYVSRFRGGDSLLKHSGGWGCCTGRSSIGTSSKWKCGPSWVIRSCVRPASRISSDSA